MGCDTQRPAPRGPIQHSTMKGKQTQQTQNTFAYHAPVEDAQYNQAVGEFGNMVNDSFNTADPSIQYNFARMRNESRKRMDNPFGANYSPEARDAFRYASDQELNQAQGQALREDAFQRKQGKLLAKATEVGFRAPQLVTSQSNSQGTVSQPWGPALIGAAGSIGSAAM